MKQRALVADVDPSSAKTLEEVLNHFDYDLALVRDDESAYKTFVEFGPDVVFVDTLLPRKGAFELIKKIRQTEGGDRTSVYVTSAIRGGALKEEALNVWGAAGFLPKPLDALILRSQLAPALSAQESQAAGADSGEAQRASEEGEVSRTAFPPLFASLLKRQNPVRLALGLGKAVHISGNNITFARSNVLSETLASYLLDRKQISEEQYREGIRVSVDEKKMIGAALISIGALTQEDIDRAIRDNIIDKVRNIFTWKTGWYKVLPYAEPPAAVPGEPIDGWRILWEELNTTAGKTAISEAMTHYAQKRLSQGQNPFEAAEISGFPQKDIQRVVLLSNGKTLLEACEDVGSKKLALLYYLILGGALELEGGPQKAARSPSELFEEKKTVEVARRLSWMNGRNFFQILGVGTHLADADIKTAYERALDELRMGMEVLDPGSAARRMIEEASETLGKAYEGLATREKRDDYLESLKHGGEAPQNHEERAKKAEAFYKEGLTAIRCQRWDEAVDRIGWAVDMNPQNPEYLIRLADALTQRGGSDKLTDLNRAESCARKALEIDGENPEPYLVLAHIQNVRGRPQQALEELQKALAIRPSYQPAILELRKLQEKSKGGGFSLFKKK